MVMTRSVCGNRAGVRDTAQMLGLWSRLGGRTTILVQGDVPQNRAVALSTCGKLACFQLVCHGWPSLMLPVIPFTFLMNKNQIQWQTLTLEKTCGPQKNQMYCWRFFMKRCSYNYLQIILARIIRESYWKWGGVKTERVFP
jgi:hypothetical protein